MIRIEHVVDRATNRRNWLYTVYDEKKTENRPHMNRGEGEVPGRLLDRVGGYRSEKKALRTAERVAQEYNVSGTVERVVSLRPVSYMVPWP